MMQQLQVSKCLGCDEEFCGPSQSSALCPDCVRLDALYEAKRMQQEERARVKAAIPRIDVGVVPYQNEYPHLAPVLGLLAGMVCVLPAALWCAWHFGRMLIAFLAGAR